MTAETNIRVIVDFESLIDSLLSHAEEDNCTHSVMDLLDEFFDNKNSQGFTRPPTRPTMIDDRHTHAPSKRNREDILNG